jgi:hypothetical protein
MSVVKYSVGGRLVDLSNFTGIFTDQGGNIFHYQNGLLHREGDLPALIEKNGTQSWWKHGKLHRMGGPAVYRSGPGPCARQEYYNNHVKGYRKGHTLVR